MKSDDRLEDFETWVIKPAVAISIAGLLLIIGWFVGRGGARDEWVPSGDGATKMNRRTGEVFSLKTGRNMAEVQKENQDFLAAVRKMNATKNVYRYHVVRNFIRALPALPEFESDSTQPFRGELWETVTEPYRTDVYPTEGQRQLLVHWLDQNRGIFRPSKPNEIDFEEFYEQLSAMTFLNGSLDRVPEEVPAYEPQIGRSISPAGSQIYINGEWKQVFQNAEGVWGYKSSRSSFRPLK